MSTEPNDDIQAALFDIQRYLLDQIPPLTASAAVEMLMTASPELLMRLIQAWSAEQSRMQEASKSDLLFHALRKVYLFGALKLIERSPLEQYVDSLIPLAMNVCPPDERDLLRYNLASVKETLGFSGTGQSNVVEVTHHTPKAAPAAAAPPVRNTVASAVSDVVSRSARRLSMVVERLTRRLPFAGTNVQEEQAVAAAAPSAQLVTMAAASSSSEEELKEFILQLSAHMGGGTDPEKLFHVLAGDVPDWDIVIPEAGKQPAAIEAMHKIIALTPSPLESARRLRELMKEAVEQFNNGALAACVSMLELAARVIIEKKLDASMVDRIRDETIVSLSSERLKKYVETRSKHPLLRKALGFFPTLTTQSLFEQLRGEQRPERRRSLLGLLEAWGSDARTLALVELENELNRAPEQVDTYYQRNLIYLLHRIARESDEGAEKEFELLSRSSARGQNIYVIKEAVLPLGQMKGDAAAKLLTTRLAEFEAILIRKDTSLYPTEEMHKILDRIVTALGRIATPSALLNVARHGMKPNPLLGDTRARLAVLSSHDLSFDEKTVDRLMMRPRSLFGRSSRIVFTKRSTVFSSASSSARRRCG